MENLLKALADYYILFILLALIGIFAIIGYFIDKKHPIEKEAEPTLDMDAVAKKGGVGLGTSLNQNPSHSGEEVEQLDMNIPSNDNNTILMQSNTNNQQ